MTDIHSDCEQVYKKIVKPSVGTLRIDSHTSRHRIQLHSNTNNANHLTYPRLPNRKPRSRPQTHPQSQSLPSVTNTSDYGYLYQGLQDDANNLLRSATPNSFNSTSKIIYNPSSANKKDVGAKSSLSKNKRAVSLCSDRYMGTQKTTSRDMGIQCDTGPSNKSDQVKRFEKEHLSKLKGREMKKNSEVPSHRADRLYYMCGTSMPLNAKYSIEDDELERLREISHSRTSYKSERKIKGDDYRSLTSPALSLTDINGGNLQINLHEESGIQIPISGTMGRAPSASSHTSTTENTAALALARQARLSSIRKAGAKSQPGSAGSNASRSNKYNVADGGSQLELNKLPSIGPVKMKPAHEIQPVIPAKPGERRIIPEGGEHGQRDSTQSGGQPAAAGSDKGSKDGGGDAQPQPSRLMESRKVYSPQQNRKQPPPIAIKKGKFKANKKEIFTTEFTNPELEDEDDDEDLDNLPSRPPAIGTELQEQAKADGKSRRTKQESKNPQDNPPIVQNGHDHAGAEDTTTPEGREAVQQPKGSIPPPPQGYDPDKQYQLDFHGKEISSREQQLDRVDGIKSGVKGVGHLEDSELNLDSEEERDWENSGVFAGLKTEEEVAEARAQYRAKKEAERARKKKVMEVENYTYDNFKISDIYNFISKSQREVFERIFNQLDVENKGKLTNEDLQLRMAGWFDKKQLQYLLKVFDLNKDKTVDIKEFVTVAALNDKLLGKLTQEGDVLELNLEQLSYHITAYKEMFEVMDQNQDGRLSLEEVMIMLSTAIGTDIGADREVADKIYKTIDTNENGTIEFVEFLSYIPFFLKLHQHIMGHPVSLDDIVKSQEAVRNALSRSKQTSTATSYKK